VLRRHFERPTGPMTWHRVDAAGVFADAVANARRALASLPP
jgi:hypothetical protein